MHKEKVEIDFYKEMKLPNPTCGLVNKVLSSKGIRKLNEQDRYEYGLKDELIQVYDGEPASVESGIYWVMDIYKTLMGLKWNHYLFVIDVDNDEFYPVAEFLDCNDSTWIKKAIPYLKKYFSGGDMEPIRLTKCKAIKELRGWKSSK